MKKFLFSIIAFVLALSTVACMNGQDTVTTAIGDNTTATDTIGEDDENGDETTAIVYPEDNFDFTWVAPDTTLLKLDDMDISVFALRYFFANAFTNFYQQNYSEITQYFDPMRPMHSQKPKQSEYAEYESWYDYFLFLAKRDLEYYLVFASEAKKEGLTLTDAEIAEVDSNVNQMVDAAKSYNISFAEYMQEFKLMGPDLTPEIVKKTYYIFQLATKYSKKLFDNFEVTTDELDEYFNEHKDYYSLADYNLLTIIPKFDATSTESEIKAAKDKASKEADDFIAYINEGKTFPEAYRLVYPDLSTSKYKEFDESYAITRAECYFQNYKGENVKTDITEWLFADGRQAGELTKLTDSQGRIKVVQAAKTPYKMTDPVPSIRYIYIDLSLEKYTEKTAVELAKQIIADIEKATDKDAEFVKLVEKYSDDVTTNKTGGLVENILPTSLEFPENVVKWCVEDGRKLYDCGYQEFNSYGVVCGYFITFISSHGVPYYEYVIDSALRGEKLADHVKESLKNIEINYTEEYMDSIYK